MRTVMLDNEAIMALADVAHRKHRAVVAHLAATVSRRRSRATAVRVLVPTAVRVEAGWDRTRRESAGINRFPVHDVGLDSASANVAAGIHRDTGVGVTDAHVGAVARSLDGEVIVLTSDLDDIQLAAAPRPVTAVRV